MPRITITILGNQPQPYRFGLERAEIKLGRGDDCDIIVDCKSVSATHAVIRRVKGGYELHDLGSTNGIKWKGEYVTVVALENEMTVSIGDASLDFELSGDEQSDLAQESAAKMLPPLREQDVQARAPIVTGVASGVPKKPKIVQKSTSYASGVWVALFIVLAIVFFVIGVAIRFGNEAGSAKVESVQKSAQPPTTGGVAKP